MNSKDFKQIIFEELAKILKVKRFKKYGNCFKFSNGDLIYYVELQSSKYSTAPVLIITLNIGIGSEQLYLLEEKYITNHLRGHYIRRIGDYLDEPGDKWWTIKSYETAFSAAEEISAIITSRVLAEFAKIKTTDDMREIWLEEVSSGRYNYETLKYLKLLENKAQ